MAITWETFGAALAVVASIISNLGVNIQKYSHARDAELPEAQQRPYIQRPLWWLGLTLVILGSIGDFTAFGFATQSLVAALGGGSTLVANVFTAYFLNKEALYLTDIGGVLFVIGGVVLIAYIAEPNVEYPLPELEKRFVRQPFVIYIVVVGVLMVSMLATIKGSIANRLKNQVQSSKRKQKQLMKSLETRIHRIEERLYTMEERLNEQQGPGQRPAALDPLLPGGSSSGNQSPMAPGRGKHPVGELLDGVTNPARVPFYYAICSGIIGSMTVLLAKCSAVMISLSIKGENQFHYPVTYVFIGGMFAFIVVQTHFLNLATALGDIMTVFPIFQACWITFSVVGGAVFYDADESFTPQEWTLYPLALLSIALGVGLLVQHTAKAEAEQSLSSRGDKKTSKSKEYSLLADDEVCLITDPSMRSPLLDGGDEMDDSGYLQLEA
ncbi:hypothetical protein Poli38472_002729 [Pythium oligandrum]|uniref:Magnesium transporter n=1 Tax=Pythium oligandrum TaxID=41045 RepID=A0A8K1CJY8_PYTOL|nr:hypothetical protein Poli38472_002729 [Pythium oligandrum]|eukprot:TMW63788.1 hypothetical protein Poli38472_002729 [Pythium oligandrum]